MHRYKIIIIPLFFCIFGGCIIFGAMETWRRSKQVRAEPTEITCRQLIEQGPRGNRHIRITEAQFADDFAWEAAEDSENWSYVLIPIYPAGLIPIEDGSDIRLIGKIDVKNAQELEGFLAKPEATTGCVWENFEGATRCRRLLANYYSGIDPYGYQVVLLGDEVPTIAIAKREFVKGAALVLLGVAILAWMIYGWVRRSRKLSTQAWYPDPKNANDPVAAPIQTSLPGGVSNRVAPPSAFVTTLRSWAYYASLAGLPIMGIFYFGSLGFLPARVAAIGMGVGAVCLVAGAGLFLMLCRTFEEQTYEQISTNRLSRFSNKFFERATNSLCRSPMVELHGLTLAPFTKLGDIAVIDGVKAQVRLLLSADGCTLVSLESALRQTAFNMYSVTADGTLIHTSSIDLERDPCSPLPTKYMWMQTSDILEAYVGHLASVGNHLKENPDLGDCQIIEPDFALGVMDYAHRISGWSLGEAGIAKKGLPALPKPAQLTHSVNGEGYFVWQARPHAVTFSIDVKKKVAETRAAIHDEGTPYQEDSSDHAFREFASR